MTRKPHAMGQCGRRHKEMGRGTREGIDKLRPDSHLPAENGGEEYSRQKAQHLQRP